MRIGSLFSGAGGLDLAVEQVFGASTAWHCEIDSAVSKVLAARWPGVPNLGDITTIGKHPKVSWDYIEPVDILCGGFPCQDVSAAGRRAGIKVGTRSGLWALFADAIAALRPAIAVIENVRGLLSAEAHRAMERNDPIVGNGSAGFVLRAAGAVLGDLADLGYDAQWATVAASDIGAPHRRERVFILATNTERIRCDSRFSQSALTGDEASGSRHSSSTMPTTDTHRARPGRETDDARGRESDFAGRDMRVQPNGRRPANAQATPRDAATNGAGPVELLPTPAARESGASVVEVQRMARGDLLPTPQASDWDGGRRRSQDVIDTKSRQIQLTDIPRLLPTPSASDGDPKAGPTQPENRINQGHHLQLLDLGLSETIWGKYEPAIRRWETLTRPAPSPIEPNTKGNPRLSAAFSEWLMGWPAGWVTGLPISRNDQLRIIGNGVVPQQAIAAIRWLLSVSEAAA